MTLAEAGDRGGISLAVSLFAEILDGRNSRLADGVQRALGRPPRFFGLRAIPGRRLTATDKLWSCELP